MPERNYITVVGSSNTDLVLECEHLPSPGETVMGGKLRQCSGGKGANQAVAAARAISNPAIKVAFVGAYGNDDFGRNARHNLRNEGIDVRYFRCEPSSTSGVALILIGGAKRENIIAVSQSANDTLNEKKIQSAKVLFKKSKVVLCQLEIPIEAVMETARMAADCGAQFILNPAPARVLPRELYPLIDILTPNKTEALLLTGATNARSAARKLLSWGCQRLAITLGEAGVLLYDQDGFREIAAPKVKPQDTVGAGDCFNGWLAVGLAEEDSFEKAAARAVQAAAISVTREGAQSSMPLRNAVKVLL
jgi:ribokinase